MGYRELLKKYIRFVEAQAGDHFIDSIGYGVEPLLFSNREHGELRAILRELTRVSDDEAVRGQADAQLQLSFAPPVDLLWHHAATGSRDEWHRPFNRTSMARQSPIEPLHRNARRRFRTVRALVV